MSHPQSITRSLRRTTPVVLAARLTAQGVALVVLAVLWPLLGQEPYGLLGMAIPLLLLLRVFMTGGLDVATIQRADLDDRRLSALFWITQALGLAMGVVTAACAPLLAWFFGEPRLTGLTLVLAGIAPATCLGSQHLALLQRRLRLGAVAVLHLAALSLAGVAAVIAAWHGWGVWALVVQQYVELLVLAAGAWAMEPWRPRFTLRGAGAGPLVRFGGHYTLSSLMFYLTTNVDKILIGHFLGPTALGLYSQAFNLMMRPVNVVMTPLTGVMMPALCRAAQHREDYAAIALGFFRFIALAMLPAGMGLTIVAPELVGVLGGPEWAGAGPVLRVLAAAILAQGFFNALGSLFVSAGRADRLARASAAVAGTFIVAFALGIYWGQRTGQPLLAVAMSYSCAMLLVVFPPYLLFALRTAGIGVRAWLAQLRTAALATAAMGLTVAACHVLLPLDDAALLAVELLAGTGIYVLLVRREIAWLLRAR